MPLRSSTTVGLAGRVIGVHPASQDEPDTAERRPSEKGILDPARVVVVGDGVIGCSVAYYLAQLGWSEVVVLE